MKIRQARKILKRYADWHSYEFGYFWDANCIGHAFNRLRKRAERKPTEELNRQAQRRLARCNVVTSANAR